MSDPALTSSQFDASLSCVECGGASLERKSDKFQCGSCGAAYEIIDSVASFFREESAATGPDSDRMEFWNQGWNDTSSPFATVEREDPAELREAFHSMLTAQRYPAVIWLSEENVRDRVLRPGARAVIALYATRSAAFYWYRIRAVLAGNFTKRSVERWVDRRTEGEWQTDGRENQHTRFYTRSEFRGLIENAGFKVTRIEQSQLQLGDIPVMGRIFRPLLPSKALRKCIAPFGMMLIAECSPNDK
jgi:hypothetical protein